MEKFLWPILGDENVTLNKLDPEMLLSAMERMALLKDEVVIVGDSLIDIEAAKCGDSRLCRSQRGDSAFGPEKASPQRSSTN